MDMSSILCCYSIEVYSTYFTTQKSVLWVHKCLVCIFFFKWSLKKVECNNVALRMSSKKCLHKNVVCNTPNVVCYNLLSATFCWLSWCQEYGRSLRWPWQLLHTAWFYPCLLSLSPLQNRNRHWWWETINFYWTKNIIFVLCLLRKFCSLFFYYWEISTFFTGPINLLTVMTKQMASFT